MTTDSGRFRSLAFDGRINSVVHRQTLPSAPLYEGPQVLNLI